MYWRKFYEKIIFNIYYFKIIKIADDHEVKIESDGTVAEFNYLKLQIQLLL